MSKRRTLRISGKVRAGLAIVIFFVLLAVFGPMLAKYGPRESGPMIMAPPSAEHWMGTTQLGQDVFSQFVHGARVSMAIGFLAAVIAKILSVLVGIVGGYFRGMTDEILYIVTAVFLVIPAMPLLIVLTGYLPSRGMESVAIVIAITSWAGSARVLRAQTMSLRNRDFVEAARATGESRWRIIFSEVTPNELPLIASGFLFSVITAILAEAGLSFLGLGSLTITSWGSMLYFAQASQAFLFGAWWWFVPPGLAIALIGAGLALINFGVDEYANPRLRTGKTRQASRIGKRARALTGTGLRAAAAAESAANAEPPDGESVPPVIWPNHAISGDPVIDVNDLRVEYPTEFGTVHAVRDVSITLHRGEILGLAGESGSGKTTLTNTMTRLLRAPAQVTSGRVLYHRTKHREPVDVLALSPAALRAFRWSEISVVFQSAMNALNPVLTVHAQFDDVLRVHRPRMSSRERTELARTMLTKVGIDPDRVRSYPHELSGGMKQRVAIAIALVLDPDVIIMDEPTTALDLLIQREVLDQIMSLRDEFGFAIVFTTHDLSLLLEISDSIAVMRAGRLVEYGSALDVYQHAGHPYTQKLLRSLADLGARL
jgi:ABC-type dipeptide/oligopeptide/nickel transport system ATPase component/ABC-type dipeptide/oligopeptide/nickel transport system permease subunit